MFGWVFEDVIRSRLNLCMPVNNIKLPRNIKLPPFLLILIQYVGEDVLAHLRIHFQLVLQLLNGVIILTHLIHHFYFIRYFLMIIKLIFYKYFGFL